MRPIALFLLFTGLVCAEPLDAILARMDAAAKTSNSFAANVSIEKYTKILRKVTSTDTGTMKLHRVKDHVLGRMDIEKPDPFTWHFAGDTFEQYLPGPKELRVWQVSKIAKGADRYLLLSFGTTSAELRKTFDIKGGPEETAAGAKTTRIDLTPKDKKAAEYAAKVELWIPAGQSYAVQQRVTEPNGNSTTYVYTGVKVNPAIPESDFNFAPPAGTKRVVMK